MDIEPWLHLGHILGAIAWVGGGSALFAMGVRARGNPDADLAEFGRVLAFVGPRLVLPGVLAVLVFGVWMVLLEGGDFTVPWIAIGLILLAAAVVVGIGFLARAGSALASPGVAMLDGGARRRLLDRWLVGYSAVMLILVVAVWDMVIKPGT